MTFSREQASIQNFSIPKIDILNVTKISRKKVLQMFPKTRTNFFKAERGVWEKGRGRMTKGRVGEFTMGGRGENGAGGKGKGRHGALKEGGGRERLSGRPL